MRLFRIEAKDYPPKERGDELLLVSVPTFDLEFFKHVNESAKEYPVALLLPEERLYQEALANRETFPNLFLVRVEYPEALLLSLAEKYLSAQDGAVPKELMREYLPGLMDKYYLLDELINAYAPNEKLSTGLKKIIHKLAGNTGAYGFDQTSQLCKETEKALDENPVESKEYFSQFLTRFADSLKEAKEAPAPLQSPPEPTNKPPPPQTPIEEGVDLLLVDDDVDLTKQMEARFLSEGIRVACFNDFAMAKEQLVQIQAKIILIDINSGQEVDGYGLMQHLLDHPEQREGTLVGFLTGKISTEEKLSALKYRIDLYLEKPLDIDLLIHYLRALTAAEIPAPIHVLLIDDDADFTKQLEANCQKEQLEVSTLNRVDTLFDSLIEVQPHVIVIDYRLEEIKGSDLIEIIRDDLRFQTIPIMLISGKADEDMFREIARLNVAGFIEKPVDSARLYTKLYDLFQKQAFRDYLRKTDPIYGIKTHSELEHFFNTVKPVIQKSSLATFSLSPRDEQRQLTIESKKAFVKCLGDYFSQSVPIGLWDEDHYLLLSPSYTLTRLQLLIEDFIKSLGEKEYDVLVGFAQYPQNGQLLGELAQQAIKSQGPRVVIQDTTLEHEILAQGKKALFISSDHEISDLLQFALKQRNVGATHIHEGSEGVSWMRERLFKEEPDIIVIDFDLPYENGPLLLERMADLVGDRIPIVVLSSKKVGPTILEMLEKESFSYIPKPFSVNHFTRIVMRALSR